MCVPMRVYRCVCVCVPYHRTFEVEYEYLGSVQKKELIPNGANTPVTEQNGLQYVQLYTKW